MDEHRRQLGLARALAPHVASLRHEPDLLELAFGTTADGPAIHAFIDAERAASPFLSFAYDEGARRLAVTLADERGRTGLAALAAAFAR